MPPMGYLCILVTNFCALLFTDYTDTLIIQGKRYGEDFVDQVVYDSQFRVYSQTNLSNDNFTSKNFTLPENTLFWSYWFVVKQGDEDPWAYAVRELSNVAAQYTSDPLTALSLGLIRNIPALQEHTKTLDVYFTDQENSQLYMDGSSFHYYPFGLEENVVNTAATIYQMTNEPIYITAHNTNFTKGLDAYLRALLL